MPAPSALATRHSSLDTFPPPLAANSFTICTYKKHACNSCRICTSKTKDLKPRRINTYKKTGGWGVLLLTRYPTKGICPERPTGTKDLNSMAACSASPQLRPTGAKDLTHTNKTPYPVTLHQRPSGAKDRTRSNAAYLNPVADQPTGAKDLTQSKQSTHLPPVSAPCHYLLTSSPHPLFPYSSRRISDRLFPLHLASAGANGSPCPAGIPREPEKKKETVSHGNEV